jgi:G3E family GTPase
MTKIDVFSGFLGAGKTTLIKKLIAEAYQGEKVVLIENEFGEIAVDGGFLKEAGVQITEMNSGCICCSLVGDFGRALKQVISDYHPDRILIEPSGVGKLSDVVAAVEKVTSNDVVIGSRTTVADAQRCKMYMKNFGEFYDNQVANAGTIVLSRTQSMKEDKLAETVAMLREKNPEAVIVTTPWDELTGAQLLAAMEQGRTLAADLAAMAEETCPVCGHVHDHDDDDDDDDEHEHHHHHHDHDHDHEHEHEHEHHHHDHDDDDDDDDDDECGCGHDHDHEHHHHHHHADEVFTSWGVETAKKFTKEQLEDALEQLDDSTKYGTVLRAKGIVAGVDGEWFHFDHVPGEAEVRLGTADVTGRLCVIGSELHEDALKTLFGV